MKISSLTPEVPLHAGTSSLAPEPVFASLRNALASARATLNQIGTAVALGEAGDLDGAQAWREQHGAK